jgi:hypothetical protein
MGQFEHTAWSENPTTLGGLAARRWRLERLAARNARKILMRSNIGSPLHLTTRSRALVATCHSGRSCTRFRDIVAHIAEAA